MTYLRFINIIWELPLGILSFLFYRLVRKVFKAQAKRKARQGKQKNQAPVWVGLSEMLKRPRVLPYVMVTAPRWNCHAVLGKSTLFRVQSKIRIHRQACNRSANPWSMVVYHANGKTYAQIGSGTGGGEWQDIEMENGTYTLGLRCYNCTEAPEFPTVIVDSEDRIAGRSMRREEEGYKKFLETIRGAGGMFYLFLHYHAYKFVCWRKWLPGSWVRRVLLPVGDPGTAFMYGPVRENQPLSLQLEAESFNRSHVYITIYNKCSFPVHWEPVETGDYRHGPAVCNGYYIVRIIQK